MSKEISIKQSDKRFLLELFGAEIDDKASSLQLVNRFHPCSTSHPNTLFARFDESELDVIVDALTDKFVAVGLQLDSEPNELGLRIEDYIDLFVS